MERIDVFAGLSRTGGPSKTDSPNTTTAKDGE